MTTIDQIMNPAAGRPSAEQLRAALQLTIDLGRVIAAAGPEGVPEGHLYAALLGRVADLASFESLVRVLVDAGAVKRAPGPRLVWTGKVGA